MKTLRDARHKQEILVRLAAVRPDTPRRWGKMDASQMICHLRDCFLGILGDRPMQLPAHRGLWPAMKWFVLYVPVKWPQGVPTRPEFDQQLGGTPPLAFEADMRALLAAIDKFAQHADAAPFQPHPMFGRMSERDWMRWGYLHTDHHLRQFGL